MEISPDGISFIKQEEGEKLTAYRDSRGILTIGVGHTGLVASKTIADGMVITSEQSNKLLLADISHVEHFINEKVSVSLTQNQYDALCSLVFNIGVSAFNSSTLLKKLNQGDYEGAAEAMLLWKRAGQLSDVLLPRRKREAALFLKK
ncbi:lysozyme [Erwinia persicina]|uniref:lysozyme n=1 Tax=Erwinia persicina TaxID=55211 RepID=UPI00209F18E5|nr:lysozyme [Erwinia persicina]MCP1440031.1 lysozyme [Erwinia persicina]